MIVSEFFKHFYSCCLTSCKHYLNVSQKKHKNVANRCIELFSEKLLQIQYIDVAPAVEVCRLWCTIGKMQPQYENMHTREQSVPSFCSCCDPPSPSHWSPFSYSILFMSKDPGNTTSVSALIYTMNTRGRRIYIHLKMALYSTNNLHHMKTQWRILCVQIFL